jgi:hypothetical protein
MNVAIEAKASPRIGGDHLKGLRNVKLDQPRLAERIVVSLEPRARRTDDGILVLPARSFAERLWKGDLF